MKDKKFILLVDGIEVECEAASSFNIEIEEPKGFDRSRRGSVIIDRGLFLSLDFDVLSCVFGKFVPMWIDEVPFDRQIIYYGYSQLFDQLEDGEKTPNYGVVIIKKEDGYDVEFKREKQ